MKIGYNARVLHRHKCGITNYAYNLLLGLMCIAPENEYFLFSPKQEDYLSLSEIDSRFKEFISLPRSLKSRNFTGQILKMLWEMFYLPCELKMRKVNLFHGLDVSLPLFLKTPKIITVHDLTPIKFGDHYLWKHRFQAQLVMRGAIEMADFIIADSESTKQDIIKIYQIPEDRIRVIYLGVSEDSFELPTEEEQLRVLQQFSLNDNPYILNVSVINPRKNIPNLMKAFTLIKDKYKDLKLVLAGQKGWLNDEMEKTIANLKLEGRVIFTGYIEENILKTLYNKAIAFVYPSLYEGFGLPILEAMACGTPVITSNISSMPEILGDAGMLVDPLNCEQIANSIVSLMENASLREDCSRRGKERARLFTWEKTARETLKTYNFVL